MPNNQQRLKIQSEHCSDTMRSSEMMIRQYLVSTIFFNFFYLSKKNVGSNRNERNTLSFD
jgi:hypothetical protein